MGIESPHIALPLNVGFTHRHNVSDVIILFQRVVTRLAAADDVRRVGASIFANEIEPAAASSVTTS